MDDPLPVRLVQSVGDLDPVAKCLLERKARSEGKSKAALIRRYVRERLIPLPPIEKDPLWRFVGVDDFEPSPVDEVVYR